MNMPALETERLLIRPLTMADFEVVCRILDPNPEDRRAPAFNAFALLPSFRARPAPPRPVYSPEVGLYYHISQADRRQGYATEAARALIGYAFETLNLRRIVATTDHDNHASIAVMEALGMRIERNPSPDPPWLQAVGVLENPALTSR